jgi:glucokinase
MIVLACDLGATRIKLGLVESGRVLGRQVLDSHSHSGMAGRLPEVAHGWRRLCADHGLTPEACAGVSLSVPSLMDPVTGRVLAEYGRYRDMPELDLLGWARKEFGLPAAIENDARMAAIGEWQYGAGRGCNDLVMVTLGTGLGTGVVMGGQVLRGRHGQAGCLGGHLTVRYGGRPCGCGNVGCAEAEASTAVLAELACGLPDFPSSGLAREPVLDFSAVFRLASAGDACAAALRDQGLLVWGSLAVSLVHAYDPGLLVLGGGIMASAETIVPAVQEYLDAHAHTPWGKVRVAPTQLGDDAALVAGEWLLLQRQK